MKSDILIICGCAEDWSFCFSCLQIKDCDAHSFDSVTDQLTDFLHQSGCGSYYSFNQRDHLVSALLQFHAVDKHKEALER